MQVLSDLIPITNGEVFDIIRRNRDQRNIKSLPHFHAQSASSTTGSSAHQHLVMTSRFAHHNDSHQDKPKESLIIVQPSLLTANQAHNIVPHTEVKVLHYLQKERDFYGPSSVVLRRFQQMEDYRASDEDDDDDDDEEKASDNKKIKVEEVANEYNGTPQSRKIIQNILAHATIQGPTPLATLAQEHQQKVKQGLIDPISTATNPAAVPSSKGAASSSTTTAAIVESCNPTLFAFDNTRDNVIRLDHALSSLRDNGQKQTRLLIAALRNRCFVGTALVDIMLKAWADQTSGDKNSYENQIAPVNKTLIERGVAKCLVGGIGGSIPNLNSLSSLNSGSSGDFYNATYVQNVLASHGVAIPPTVLRNIVDIRHSLSSAAHVAAVIPSEMDWVGNAAEFVLRVEAMAVSGNKSQGSNNNNTSGAGNTISASLIDGFKYSAAEHVCRATLNVLKEFQK